ncbi:MAG: hypothetical protein NTW79_03055 [Candidatus Berkelbacteria bacterium]|nr:hypothetical protein [Candidatus Berkelbacteria bacterium]
MLDFLKKPIFLVIIAVALIGGGLWYYFSNRASQQAATEASKASTIANLTNASAATFDDAIKTELATADAQSVIVDKKATLCAVDVDLPQTLANGSGNSIFGYNLSVDKINNWTISISNTSGKFLRALVPKTDYLGTLSAINRSFWKINYVFALQIAEKNGGQDFRNLKTITDVDLTLKNGGPNSWLYWYVTYNAGADVKTVQIDANTGVVITN